MTADLEEFPLNNYRSYLMVLARVQLGRKYEAKMDASDVVQQTLLDAVAGWNQFRGASEGEVASWLRRILARTIARVARDLSRQKRDIDRERSLEASLNESSLRLECFLADDQSGPDQKAARAEEVIQLTNAIESLADDQRDAIIMFYWQGMNVEQIAEGMQRSRSSVAGLLYRGLEKLRTTLR